MLKIISHLCDNNMSVKMASCILKQSENFKLLHKCLPSQRKLSKYANPPLIHAFCDCTTNITHQNIPITANQKRALAKCIENIIKQQNKNL